MRIGVVFPQTEFPGDAGAIRDYVQTAEALGYTHVLAYDHILGANPQRPGGWTGPYNFLSSFQEPLVLFSFMAGVTTTLEFVSGIIILPQRETAMVAKQAASVDVLSGGRLRLGIGIGWNQVEYTALNKKFSDRGRRVEEQVELLQRLWTEPLVTFEGKWHTIPDAGINPLPIQRPIPIWFGGHADPVLRRTARWGAGWLPNYRTAAEAEPALAKLAEYLSENGRSREDLGLEPRLQYGKADLSAWDETIEGWRNAGATHLTLNTMAAGFRTAEDHIGAIRHFAETMLPSLQAE